VTGLNLLKQYFIGFLAFALWPALPGIITVSGYLQHTAHLLHPEIEAVGIDKLIFYFRWFAKMAAAFFNMAFSSSRSAMRRFSFLSSSSSGLSLPLPGNAFA